MYGTLVVCDTPCLTSKKKKYVHEISTILFPIIFLKMSEGRWKAKCSKNLTNTLCFLGHTLFIFSPLTWACVETKRALPKKKDHEKYKLSWELDRSKLTYRQCDSKCFTRAPDFPLQAEEKCTILQNLERKKNVQFQLFTSALIKQKKFLKVVPI